MSFIVRDGRLTVTDAAGVVKIDSAERPFIVTDYLVGAVEIAARDPRNGASLNTIRYPLGTCELGSNWIMGACRIVIASGISGESGIISLIKNMWFNANGTVVWDISERKALTSTVAVEGTQVYLYETFYHPHTVPGPQIDIYPAYRYQYRLNIGRLH